jgi:HPt (histidine-containing phosphotransfer) domain-containing protein
MPDAHDALIRDGLAQLWKRSKPSVMKRIKAVSTAIQDLAAGAPAPGAIETARQQAHQLAGSLGTFGLPNGSKTAKAIEVELERDTPRAEELQALVSALAEAAQNHDPAS